MTIYLKHKYINKFIIIQIDSNGYYNIVLQYANEENLREYLKANFIKLQWADKLYFAKEIVLGLLFLHEIILFIETL